MPDPTSEPTGRLAGGEIVVEVLTPAAFAQSCERLGEILADAVRSGAGVSFVLPFTAADGRAFWLGEVAEVERAARLPLVARTGPRADDIVGTVSLLPVLLPNQPHRAEISKLLVHSDHRRRGVARTLMTAASALAIERGRTLLTLDCVAGGPAEMLYRSLGFTVVGVIPGYALSPSGQPEGATLLYRNLSGPLS